MSRAAIGNRIVIPSARRLMASLRDIGYDPPAAVADLVDNSIDAGAARVDIDITSAGADSWLRIADDGVGMTARELDEAMRYGSSRQYGELDLGNFGLGLKTASLSQCRRLTVAARTTERGRIEARRWDLDTVSLRDAWELERLTSRACPEEAIAPLRTGPGTVVLWERLDRILGYARPDGAAAARGLEMLAAEIRAHLAMVFHRFLSGETRGRRRLLITLNGERIRPWDPFARREAGTQRLRKQSVALVHGRSRFRVPIRPYILPNQVQFSSAEAHAAAAGPRRWNRQQGLYIYRRDRLIQSGGWNRLRTLDEHSKLARIALDIPPGADAAFGTSVSKMAVILPVGIRAELRTLVSGVVARAQDTYRQRVRAVDHPTGLKERAPWVGLGATATSMADNWPVICAILERELGGQPDVLRRVLTELANATVPRTSAIERTTASSAPVGQAGSEAADAA